VLDASLHRKNGYWIFARPTLLVRGTSEQAREQTERGRANRETGKGPGVAQRKNIIASLSLKVLEGRRESTSESRKDNEIA